MPYTIYAHYDVEDMPEGRKQPKVKIATYDSKELADERFEKLKLEKTPPYDDANRFSIEYND